MIEIKTASADNAEALVPLFSDYQSIYGISHPPKALKKFLDSLFTNHFSLFLIATYQGEIIAFLHCTQNVSSMAMKSQWFINDLFVIGKFRRQKVATLLFECLEKKAKKESVFSLKINTQTENKKAQKLYEFLGYVKSNSFSFYSKTFENKKN